ncbi:hypothetical protein BDR07DRAFT_1613397 [Suillus spraguei]|nr:hypothetical protein BDR07DRAFT_1613397 [Suillus spraguei]
MKSEIPSCLPSRHSYRNSNESATVVRWSGGSHQNEPGMPLNAMHDVPQYKPQVDGHVPEMIWLHQIEEASTEKLRRGLEIADYVRCSRILNIHISWKLQPIKKLSGKEFKHAWWVAIICHRILWISGVYQYDVNPSNLMVYRTLNGFWMGVINDYDLSSSENGSGGGHKRIGMIPFMAIDLLTKKAMKYKAEHLYQHIAESFIWVLIWVGQYEDGKILSKDRPPDCWLTAFGNASDCHKIKWTFLTLAIESRIGVSPPPKPLWELDLLLLTFLISFYVEDRNYSVLERECMFRTWFEAQLPSTIRSVIHSRQPA